MPLSMALEEGTDIKLEENDAENNKDEEEYHQERRNYRMK